MADSFCRQMAVIVGTIASKG